MKKLLCVLFFFIFISNINAQEIKKSDTSKQLSQNTDVQSKLVIKKLENNQITNKYTIEKIKKFREQYKIDWFQKKFGKYSDCENPWHCSLETNSKEEYNKAKCSEQEPFKSEEEYQQKCELKGVKFTEQEIKSMLVAMTYIFSSNPKERIYDIRIAEYIIPIIKKTNENPNNPDYTKIRDFIYSNDYMLSVLVMEKDYLFPIINYYKNGNL